MSDTIITVQSLCKSYFLKHKNAERYIALRDVLTNKAKSILNPKSHPDRYRDINSKSEEFWALKDISFEIQQGERVGIIGRNGAGKSTLLKILSRIVAPTRGRIIIDGRVSSLLEVGTGFHPELTGRENIFLNGSILGMSKSEIINKFDEIVAFAEIEKFLDTPVKRYSSGMYVRLAFAVAAHLEPEILIVDEVLAVGDAEFQKKCLGKMKDVSGQGRTVLFVSHNMEAVQKLCNKGILLQRGQMVENGNIEMVIRRYQEVNQNSNATFNIPIPEKYEEAYAYAYKIQTEDSDGNIVPEVPLGSRWSVRIFFKVNKRTPRFIIALGFSTSLGMPLQTTWVKPFDIEPGDYEVLFTNEDLIYSEGLYSLIVGLSYEKGSIQYVEGAGTIAVSDVIALKNMDSIVNTKSGLLINQMKTEVRKLS